MWEIQAELLESSGIEESAVFPPMVRLQTEKNLLEGILWLVCQKPVLSSERTKQSPLGSYWDLLVAVTDAERLNG